MGEWTPQGDPEQTGDLWISCLAGPQLLLLKILQFRSQRLNLSFFDLTFSAPLVNFGFNYVRVGGWILHADSLGMLQTPVKSGRLTNSIVYIQSCTRVSSLLYVSTV